MSELQIEVELPQAAVSPPIGVGETSLTLGARLTGAVILVVQLVWLTALMYGAWRLSA